MFTAFRPFRPFDVFRVPLGGDATIRQPILLTDSEGNVFVDALGNAIFRGYARVTPIEEPAP